MRAGKTAEMSWTSAADQEAVSLLTKHAGALYEEAEAIARRAEAGAVSPTYVADAARNLRYAPRPSAIPDLLLAIGSLLIGVVGGHLVGMPSQVGPTPVWLIVTLAVVGGLGLVTFAVGVTLRLSSR